MHMSITLIEYVLIALCAVVNMNLPMLIIMQEVLGRRRTNNVANSFRLNPSYSAIWLKFEDNVSVRFPKMSMSSIVFNVFNSTIKLYIVKVYMKSKFFCITSFFLNEFKYAHEHHTY